MMEKKLKEYKVGKVKDETSNCVFNGIEDYFIWFWLFIFETCKYEVIMKKIKFKTILADIRTNKWLN